MTTTPWLVRQKGPARRMRLYCFPYAGGSATAFAGWQEALGPDFEVCTVQLPGRGARMGEAPMTSFQDVIRAAALAIHGDARVPFAFFGHSLGATLAFEVTRFLMLHSLPLPVHLFVSGCDAPQHRSASRNLHLLPDDELIEALKDYNGTPAEVLANRELMELLLPPLRADFSLVASYRYRPGLRLQVPLTVIAGRQDNHIDPLLLEHWNKESAGPCQVHWLEGDHFFVHAQRDAVHAIVRDALAETVCT